MEISESAVKGDVLAQQEVKDSTGQDAERGGEQRPISEESQIGNERDEKGPIDSRTEQA
jgi:hypothetical protein